MNRPTRTLLATGLMLAAFTTLTPARAADAPLSLTLLGRAETGGYDQGAAEIPAHDPLTQRLFVVNGGAGTVDVLSIADPATPAKVGAIDVTPLGRAANSVAVKRGVVAVAIEAAVKTDAGLVAFYDAATLALIGTAPVGALPDMLTFTPDGKKVLVANEGEPSDDYLTDPEGSVTVIDVTDFAAPVARQVSFQALNAPERRAELLRRGVRLFGPGASTAQDLEPEYITVDPRGGRAYVTLQENNAVAVIDIDRARLVNVFALGAKDHSVAGFGLDPSDRDSASAIGTWPVKGYYLPDAIGSFRVGGKLYLVTANEGDQREYTGYNETARVKDLALDATAFPDGAALKADAQIGRLNVTRAQGDIDGDTDYDVLYAFGGRSITVWGAGGAQVWDSGDAIEQQTLAQFPANFNAGSTNNTRDDRSDNKGPEPEGLVVATLWERPYVFVGLERIGGVMVWDLSAPTAPQFVTYVNPRDFTAATNTSAAGDLAPEGLIVIPATDSPTGEPLLVVANETSGTTSVFAIRQVARR